jgi:hypothetical protein
MLAIELAVAELIANDAGLHPHALGAGFKAVEMENVVAHNRASFVARSHQGKRDAISSADF